MNVYKLEHQYYRWHTFYGVRTTLTFHELNVLCAYLQLLRILAQREHPFWRNVNAISGFA